MTIGEGAYVAAGSTITEDVPQDALALGRARQVTSRAGRRSGAREGRAQGRRLGRASALGSRTQRAWRRSRGRAADVRHRRLRRRQRRGARDPARACGGSSTAATTRRASPSSRTARSCGAARPGKLANLAASLEREPLAGDCGHRPHALGDARPADARRTPTRTGLQRPDRGRAQRHHRELPGAQGAARRRGPSLRHADRHRGRRAPRRVAATQGALERGGARGARPGARASTRSC